LVARIALITDEIIVATDGSKPKCFEFLVLEKKRNIVFIV